MAEPATTDTCRQWSQVRTEVRITSGVSRHFGSPEGLLGGPNLALPVHRLDLGYRAAACGEKVKILDEFVALTGYHRKHAIRALGADATSREAQAPQSPV